MLLSDRNIGKTTSPANHIKVLFGPIGFAESMTAGNLNIF